MEELHVFKFTRIFVIFIKFIIFIHSTGSAVEISSFKTTSTLPKEETVKYQFLSSPSHPPKVETVKNQSYHDHHTLLKVETLNNQFF